VAADREAVGKAVEALAQPRSGQFRPWQYRAFAGLLAGLERQGKALTEFFSSRDAVKMEPIFNAARGAATNAAAAVSDRLAAVGVLGRTPSTANGDLPVLGSLLAPQHPSQLQEAALEGLKRSRDESVATILISNWRTLGPGARQQALSLLQSRPEWAQRLLDAIESNRIAAGEIGAAAQQKLTTSKDASVSSRAEKMFVAVRSDRRALVRQYAAELPANGDASKGAALFKQNCAVCHRVHGEGVEIGPDLAMVTGKPTEVLLEAVLDPNSAVEARYLSYNVTTRNGRELTGLISAETPNSITLRSQGGVEEVLLRSDITEMRSSGLSLMPEGLEKAFKPQDMADLLAFLRQK